MVPIDGTSPDARARSVKAQDVNWVDSTGRRNTLTKGCGDGDWAEAEAGSGVSGTDSFAGRWHMATRESAELRAAASCGERPSCTAFRHYRRGHECGSGAAFGEEPAFTQRFRTRTDSNTTRVAQWTIHNTNNI